MKAKGRRPIIRLLGFLMAVLAAVLIAALVFDGRGADRDQASERVPIAMMGDSDTEGYQKRASLWTGYWRSGALPGGSYSDITWQWPEVLARIRGHEVDLGRWDFWGVPRPLSMSRLRELVGQRWRGPYQEGYRHNFAWASPCWSIIRGPWAQAPQLRDLMDENPDVWEHGVVVIRIGVGTFGMADSLTRLASAPGDPQVAAVIDECLGAYEQAMIHLREKHPGLRFVLVGILNNAHWTKYLDLWRSPTELANIDAGLDRFDHGLRQLATRYPGVAFFDDRAWFARHFGGRGADGRPAYRAVDIQGVLKVANTAGDEPHNAVLGNEHAGMVWNVLWVQELVALMRREFGVALTPIEDDEKVAFVRAALDRHSVARADR